MGRQQPRCAPLCSSQSIVVTPNDMMCVHINRRHRSSRSMKKMSVLINFGKLLIWMEAHLARAQREGAS